MVSYPFIIFQVNGAVVNVRSKGDKLAVWLADAGEQEHESVTRIGRMIKERLGVDSKVNLCFNVHNEEKAKPGSSSKQKYFV